MNIFKKEKSYSKQKIKENLVKQWFFTFFAFAYIVFFIFYLKYNLGSINKESFLAFSFLILGFISCLIFLGIIKLINNFFSKSDSEINKARKGYEGERLVYLKLIKIPGFSQYNIIQNFKIPGRKFDFDFLIIGPKGLVVLEVKNSASSYIFTEKEAIKVNGSGYSQERTSLFGNCDPRLKLINHCKSLNYYLKSVGLGEIKARKALVFINSIISIEGKSKVFIISKLKELDKYFNNLEDDNRFTPEFCEVVADKLKQ